MTMRNFAAMSRAKFPFLIGFAAEGHDLTLCTPKPRNASR